MGYRLVSDKNVYKGILTKALTAELANMFTNLRSRSLCRFFNRKNIQLSIIPLNTDH